MRPLMCPVRSISTTGHEVSVMQILTRLRIRAPVATKAAIPRLEGPPTPEFCPHHLWPVSPRPARFREIATFPAAQSFPCLAYHQFPVIYLFEAGSSLLEASRMALSGA